MSLIHKSVLKYFSIKRPETFSGSCPATLQPVPCSSPRPPRFPAGGRRSRPERAGSSAAGLPAPAGSSAESGPALTRDGASCRFSASLPQPVLGAADVKIRAPGGGAASWGRPGAFPRRPPCCPCSLRAAAGLRPPTSGVRRPSRSGWRKSAYRSESRTRESSGRPGSAAPVALPRAPRTERRGREARPPPCHRGVTGRAACRPPRSTPQAT